MTIDSRSITWRPLAVLIAVALSAIVRSTTAQTFSPTGSMNVGRTQHTMTLLADGRILVAGGYTLGAYMATAEIYDPATGTWTMTGSMNAVRAQHTATLMPNGQVLVMGGYNGTSGMSSAEVYDPGTGTWATTAPMSTPRYAHTATLLNDGRVLVAAGYNGSARLASAELYYYSIGSWSLTGSLNAARNSHTATLLPNGKVLVAGGFIGTAEVSSCELFDPATGRWTFTGSLNTGRDMHTATLMPNGLVLVAGGRNMFTYLSSAELYNPLTGAWTMTGSLNNPRRSHVAALLLNGQVLAAGGFAPAPPGSNPAYAPVNTAELYDSVSGTWTPTGSLNATRYAFTAALLPNRQVLVAGGVSSTNYWSSAELYNPYPHATWTQLAHHSPVGIGNPLLLSDGTVFVTDGQRCAKLIPDIHGSYVNGTWTNLASMHNSRTAFASIVLRDGRVFVAGGEYGSGGNAAEVYDPQSDTWTMAPPPPYASGKMADCIAKILADGTVLIAPVYINTLGATIIYQPDSNTWSSQIPILANGAEDMAEATWVKLPDDSILAIDFVYSTSERYIPSLTNWISDATVPADVWGPSEEEGGAELLPSGQAIFFGATGRNVIYTPSGNATPGTWQLAPNFPNGQGTPDAPAAMMVNGRILCAVSAIPKAYLDYETPTSFYEYDPGLNAFTRVFGPFGLTYDGRSQDLTMLDLPDGTVLLNYGPAVYQPDGATLVSGKPSIAGISENGDGSYHLTGTGLNGISEGASFGDDAQMDSNYPLVRMTNNVTGNVYYARTFNWSSTGVMTGNKPVSTEFSVPAGVPWGAYSLVTVANGIPSDPILFGYPDILQISPAAGFTSFGTVGGPFTVNSENLTLSNVGLTSINWTAVNNASWLNISPASGVLAPGTSTTVTASLTCMASALPLGTYTTTVTFQDSNTGYQYHLTFTLFIITPPTVTTPPSDQAVLDGTTATFTVVASGGQPMWYEWFFNGVYLSGNGHISGSATPTLTINNASTADVGSYSVVVANPVGATPAYSAALSLVPSVPVITVQPASSSIYQGGSAQFSVAAVGTKPFSYQWNLNGIAIPGGNGPTLSLTNVQVNQAGCYTATICNMYGCVTSSCANLTVFPCYPPPSGLADWWRFEGNILDSVGIYNGSYTGNGGSPTFAPGEVGRALTLDGQHFLVMTAGAGPGVDPINGTGFTFECWVNESDQNLEPLAAWDGNGMSPQPSIQFSVNQGGAGILYADFLDNAGNHHTLASAPGVVFANQFQHVALTYDKASGTANLYCNGVPVSTNTTVGSLVPGTNMPPSSFTFFLGNSFAGSYFRGSIDEASFYTRALSAADIQTIYSIGAGGKCSSP